MAIKIKIKKLCERAVVPKYATSGSAACDLCFAGECAETIKPGETKTLSTGIAISMGRTDIVALVYARSGLAAKNGIVPANCVGVIDSDYRGEIKVALYNHSDREFTVSPGDRIAQLMFAPVFAADFEEVDALDETERGEGGFGSTGISS